MFVVLPSRSRASRTDRGSTDADDPAGSIQAELSDRNADGRAGGAAGDRRRRLAVRDDLAASAAPSIRAPPASSSWRWCAWCWSSRRAKSRHSSPRRGSRPWWTCMFRWLLILAVLLGIALRHEIAAASLSAPRVSDLGGGHAGGADRGDARHAGDHAPVLDERIRYPQRDHRGLQHQQPRARPAAEEKPGMRLEVAGFFDDRSTDRLGMESDAELIGPLERPRRPTSRNNAST